MKIKRENVLMEGEKKRRKKEKKKKQPVSGEGKCLV